MHRNIYRYDGPEVDLGSSLVTAKSMSIDQLEDNVSTLSANGQFTFVDHAEGCSGTDPWVATGEFRDDKFTWVVRRKDPTPVDFAFSDPETGEPLFTLLRDTNQAIKNFVAKKLTYVAIEVRKNPGTKEVVEKPRLFEGPKHKYEGPCLCERIKVSHAQNPFAWETHTNGGQYPMNCFECSCGTKWYCGGVHGEWIHVEDDATWRMLTDHDGEVVEAITLDPDKKFSTVCLLRVIRQKGYIPIN